MKLEHRIDCFPVKLFDRNFVKGQLCDNADFFNNSISGICILFF